MKPTTDFQPALTDEQIDFFRKKASSASPASPRMRRSSGWAGFMTVSSASGWGKRRAGTSTWAARAPTMAKRCCRRCWDRRRWSPELRETLYFRTARGWRRAARQAAGGGERRGRIS